MRLQHFRSTYLSCSKLAEWTYNQVGVKKPEAATGEEWDEWNKETQLNHPYVYWFNEELLDTIQDVYLFPKDIYDTFHTWITYSYIKHTPIINTHLKRGDFCAADELILHGMFSILVDFVECEKASMQLWCNKDEPRPWWMKSSLTRWAKFRNPELGLKYLDWESKLGVESPWQAKKAQDIIRLYNWWKNIRPNRVDSYDESGLTAYYADKEATMIPISSHFSSKPEEKDVWEALSDRENEISQRYEDEDTKMLMKLIEIRRGLWT
jgi:hypothetical protein